MKTKLISIIVAFALFPCNLCFAAEPTVMREYITRKSGGERSEEERLSVDYKDLWMEQGDYLVVSFLDGTDSVLEEYELELSVNDLLENELSISPESLAGVRYVKIELIGSGSDYSIIKLPFEI